MANERAPGQKLIPIPANEMFIRELNAGFKAAGYDNRSQFVRDAILEKLERLGIRIPKALALAPDRLGKGGRSRSSYPPLDRAGGLALNEKTSSKPDAAATRLLRKGAASARKSSP